MRVRLISSHTQQRQAPEVIQKHHMYALIDDEDREAAEMLEGVKERKIKHHFITLCEFVVSATFPYRHSTYIVFEETAGAILFKMLYPEYGAKMEYGEMS